MSQGPCPHFPFQQIPCLHRNTSGQHTPANPSPGATALRLSSEDSMPSLVHSFPFHWRQVGMFPTPSPLPANRQGCPLLGRQARMNAFRGGGSSPQSSQCTGISNCLLCREGPGPRPQVKAAYVRGPGTWIRQRSKHRDQHCCWGGPGETPLPWGRRLCFPVALHLATSPSAPRLSLREG